MAQELQIENKVETCGPIVSTIFQEGARDKVLSTAVKIHNKNEFNSNFALFTAQENIIQFTNDSILSSIAKSKNQLKDKLI